MTSPSFPAGAKFFDVDGIAVMRAPDGSCTAFDKDGDSWPFPPDNVNERSGKADPLTADEFAAWLRDGFNKFDVRSAAADKAS